jgi:starvation-inducible DNA-binding protein
METKPGNENRSAVLPYRTEIDLSARTRAALIPLLNQRLADLIDLFNQTKHAHWNVKGTGFIALHELFDAIAERVEESCDLAAERVVMLGGRAEGTTRQAAGRSALPEYDADAVDGVEHVRTLARQVAMLAATARKTIAAAGEAGDPTTADLFTQISRSLDKDLWFLEAHLQGR